MRLMSGRMIALGLGTWTIDAREHEPAYLTMPPKADTRKRTKRRGKFKPRNRA